MKNTNYAPHLIASLFLFAAFTSSDGCYNTTPGALPAHAAQIAPAPAHVCIDSTHYDCDGYCPCDGMECPRAPETRSDKINTREYQYDIDQEGYYIYDGGKYLGFVPFGESKTLDSLMIKDNL